MHDATLFLGLKYICLPKHMVVGCLEILYGFGLLCIGFHELTLSKAGGIVQQSLVF